MDRLINGTIRHRKMVLIGFVVAAILALVAMLQVRVNYDLQEYLPADVPSADAMDLMNDQFTFSIPNARVAVPVDDLRDAQAFRDTLTETGGIEQVIWLDSQVDLTVPFEMHDPQIVEGFYKDDIAIYQVTADTGNAAEVLNRLYALDSEIMVEGQLVDQANAQASTESEIAQISLIVAPLVLIVLLLTTHAWLEPLIFVITILVGILLNMGTNILLGEVSFITQAVAAVLQLAVSMDYAIFLLNRFNQNRQAGHPPAEAMRLAMKKGVTAISSSALTTVFGFLALIFMRFRIGSDLGIVMAKGIVFSFISVMFFMPVLLLAIYRLVDKTTHRNLLPDFSVLGKVVHEARWGLVILALVLAIPGFLGSRANTFIYGMGDYPPGSRILEDRTQIEETFGVQQQMVLMVPKGDMQAEQQLNEELEGLPEVISVVSYVAMVDSAIPQEVLNPDDLEMIVAEDYTQFIVTADVASEGDESFALVETVRDIGSRYYGDDAYLTGQNVVMSDMKDVIRADDLVVNGLAILAVGLVILFAFRSLSLPFILVLTIQIAIWVNLSIPYFMGSSLSYIGYLIISTVQLGATVDYAILYTEHYLDNRATLHKRDALIQTSKETIPSLLPPALILTIAGFALQATSSLSIVSELGQVLGRGALLSLGMVVFVLPALLFILDRVIERTTLNRTFVHKGAPASAPATTHLKESKHEDL